MYRATHEGYSLQRAIDNVNFEYSLWKKNPPATLIDNASIVQSLWLMADMHSEAGREFWQRMDRARD
jgi:hypothetical protein